MVSDNYIIDTSYLYFLYEDTIKVYRYVNKEGYIAGGNNITIYGNFTLIYGKSFDIFVGTNKVPPENIYEISIPSIKITVPAVTSAQAVQIYISYDGVTYTNETILYYYKTYSSLTSIHPNYGPTKGGTLIQVFGEDFDDQAYCLLNGVRIEPVRVDKQYMVCETAMHKAAANLPFELIFNQDVYETTTGLKFTYYNDIQINTILPQYISTYAGRNQVLIDVYGQGFMNTPDIRVRVDNQIVTPTFIDTTHLQFVGVDVIQEGQYNVFVANNGEDFQRGSIGLVIHYYKALGIQEVSPQKVQIGGPPIMITVYGYNFPTETTFYCVFGKPTTPPGLQYNVVATVISDTQLECLAPTYEGILSSYTTIPLRVSYNLQEYFGLLQIPYYPAVTLSDFTEKYFIQTMSSITIKITGTNFLNVADEATCLLEDYQSTRIKASNQYFIDGSNILCSFDMPDIGYYNVLISNNGIQFAKSVDTLKVIESIYVKNIQPKLILSANKNQMILIEATHLFQGCQCVFEIKSEYQNVQSSRDFTVGKILNDNLMLCYVPEYKDIGTAVINVRVAYQSYLKAQSQSSVLLTIMDKCPAGYACKNSRFMECPVGHYCPGGGIVQAAHQCPIGYYQDKPTSSKCKQCPKGSMCPFMGMSLPVPCTPGHICDKEKLNSPNIQCVKGSYCFQGTQTDDSNEFGLLSTLPMKCSIGSYCKPGMKTGVVVFNSNTSTPAPCKRGMVCEEGAYDAGGVGPCPGGYYCPRPNITGIPCPPRHYCPERGNTYPLKCPRGTFNFHFGQKNCTQCTLGRICPIEGLGMPLLCPPGFVCNKEGIIYPEILCRVGHICLGGAMTGTENKKRSCFIADKIDSCPNGVFYSKDIQKTFSAQKFDNYFYGSNVCCMNGTEVRYYIEALGRAIGNNDVFQSYGTIINKTGVLQGKTFKYMWDGMRFVDKAAFRNGFNDSDQFPIPVRKHREVILTYMYNMYTNYMQELCPGKQLCLEGVNTLDVGGGLISSPFDCPTGSFCQKGSDSVIGSGLCPVGFYCPPGTQDPIPAEPGTYTGAPGAVEPQICQPGTFADQYQSTECKVCPNGFECKQKKTRQPTICPLGMFRSVIQSNVCLACPRGTFNFERGAKDLLDCLECPPGRICDTENLYNVSQTIACSDGQVCSTGTGMKSTQPCPQGFYCIPETNDDTRFNNICDKGFFCRAGTGLSTKNRDTCPQTYYCPPGTGEVRILNSTKDYSTFEIDTVLTRCPYGSGDDGSDTKNTIEQCEIDIAFKLLKDALNIRPPKEEISTSNLPVPAQPNSGRLLEAIPEKRASP